MRLETTKAAPGDWVIIGGHNPQDLNNHMIKIGGASPRPAMFEGDRMLTRCPNVLGRATVYVDGVHVGSLLVETPSAD